MAKPIDLRDIMKDAGLPTDLPPDMARGVDLNAVRHKRTHKHRWSALGRYILDDEQIADIQGAIDDANAEAAKAKMLGNAVENVAITIPLESTYLFGIEGPGCLKCGKHITDPTAGPLCEKDDAEFPGLVDMINQRHANRKALEGVTFDDGPVA